MKKILEGESAGRCIEERMRESEGGWKRKVAVAAELVGGANPGKKMDMVLEEEGGRELDGGGSGVFVWFFLGERGSEVSLLGLAARLVAARGCFSELVGDILVGGKKKQREFFPEGRGGEYCEKLSEEDEGGILELGSRTRGEEGLRSR